MAEMSKETTGLTPAALHLANTAEVYGWTWGVAHGDNGYTVHVCRLNGPYFKVTWRTTVTGSRIRLYAKTVRPAGKSVWVDAPGITTIGDILSRNPIKETTS